MTSVLEEADGNKGVSAAGEEEANDAPTDPEATRIGRVRDGRRRGPPSTLRPLLLFTGLATLAASLNTPHRSTYNIHSPAIAHDLRDMATITLLLTSPTFWGFFDELAMVDWLHL